MRITFRTPQGTRNVSIGQGEKSHFGDLNHEIAAEIRRRRTEAKLTIAEVADRLGIARTTLSYVETGQRRITADYLATFAEFFGCSPHDLLPREPRRAALLKAVEARDRQRVVEALAELGIPIDVAPSAIGVGAEIEDVRRLAARQIRASTASVRAALDGLDATAQVLDPEVTP